MDVVLLSLYFVKWPKHRRSDRSNQMAPRTITNKT